MRKPSKESRRGTSGVRRKSRTPASGAGPPLTFRCYLPISTAVVSAPCRSLLLDSQCGISSPSQQAQLWARSSGRHCSQGRVARLAVPPDHAARRLDNTWTEVGWARLGTSICLQKVQRAIRQVAEATSKPSLKIIHMHSVFLLCAVLLISFANVKLHRSPLFVANK